MMSLKRRTRTRAGRMSAAAAILAAAALLAAGCGSGGSSSSASSAGGGASSGGSASGKKFTIGVSNTVVGNGWREEMICSIKAQAAASGAVSKVIVSDQNGTAPDQIAAIRNLISSGVNAIIADPADAAALNSVIGQAKSRGITFVAVDQAVTASDAYNVTNDQEKYGYLGGLWLAKKLGGHGNVLELRGIAGAPADTARQTGFEKAIKQYPGIHVVKQLYTGWQYGTAGQQALNVLQSGTKIDGIWTSGVDYTVVNALKTAGKPSIPVVGADNNAFLGQLLKGTPGAAVTNPATIGAVGTSVAIKALQGQNPSKTTLITPQVWDSQNQSTWKKFYSPKLAATYSSTLEVKPYTTYTVPQLKSCQGPSS